MLRLVYMDATLLDIIYVVSVCTPCCMLLGVVVQSLKPVKLLATCKQTLLPKNDAENNLLDLIHSMG